jgi:hypothetical protein
VGASDPGYVQFWLGYFDDDDFHEAHVLAFLRLLLTMQEALAALFARVFGKGVQLQGSVVSFDSQFGIRMRELMKSEQASTALVQLGLERLKQS